MGNYHKPDTPHVVESKPPNAEEVLIKIFTRWRSDNKSEHIPRDALDAAHWWMSHQEERLAGDTPFPAKDKEGNVKGWITPYHDRLAYNLQKFLKLSEPQKAFVIYNIERGVPYRGDDIEFYKMIVQESDRMNEYAANGKMGEYITEGFATMKKVLRKMVAA